MHDFLAVADSSEHRHYRLHEDAILPLSPSTQCEVREITLGRRITQDNQTLLTLPHEPLKRGIRHMRRGTVPGDDQAILVYHKTQCAADNPAMVREACAAEKLLVQA